MKFGTFYEHQLTRPWDDGQELRLFQEALDQVELADKLGFDYVGVGRAMAKRSATVNGTLRQQATVKG